MLAGLSLFTGIGGIDYALRSRIKPVAYCEIDSYCQSVLRARMDDGRLQRTHIFGDVRKMRGELYRNHVDIIYGGFPCQDISFAGKRAGLDGERSGLYREVVRLVAECEPSFVFLENVAAIRGHAWRVVEDLARLGFDCRWTSLSAAEVGAPHKRDRWWLLAAHPLRLKLQFQSRRGTGEGGGEDSTQYPDNVLQTTVADTNGVWELQSQGVVAYQRGRSSNSADTSWFSDIDYAISLLDDGVPSRLVEQRALGNSVVPLQTSTAFEYLMQGVK